MTTEKDTLRHRLRRARKSLDADERRRATHRTNRHLFRLLRRGKRIGAYWAVGSELSLREFIAQAQRRGACVYLPYIEKNARRLWFTPYTGSLKAGRAAPFGIPQFGGRKIRAHALHTLLVPLVGIDERGFRLGQGGGFYDTTLAHTRYRLCPRLVGVGFACQQVPYLEAEAHDAPLPEFVCEHGFRRFPATARHHADTLPETPDTSHSRNKRQKTQAAARRTF